MTFHRTVFARYALPTDDLLVAFNPTISLLEGTEDPDYPITNWLLLKPAKPAKFLEGRVRILFDFGEPANVAAFALIYHNCDEGLPCSVEWDSDPGFSPPVGTETLTIPAWTEDAWSVSPWTAITGTPTYRYWLLDLGGGSPGNSQPLVVGRPVFLGALRDLENDVRWMVQASEEHGSIDHETELGAEDIYALGGKRRRFAGEFALRDETAHPHAQALIALHRSAHGRVKPWILVPDVDVNDALMVRFETKDWTRTLEGPNHNIFPFLVRELSRGLPWPWPPT